MMAPEAIPEVVPKVVSPIVAIVGPTGAGKTELSLDLAQPLDGEIVNTDAMAIYQGMDIGTAKVPVSQRRGIAHHLLDLLPVTVPATVAEFQGWARSAVAEIRSAGRTPILVGGSALYTRAVIDSFEFPGTDPEVRARLDADLERLGPVALHKRLEELDPVAASKILPDNGRRIVRALEVIDITGEPFRATLPDLEYVDPHTIQIGVRIDRKVLDERIGRRVDEMFEGGFVDEVRRLLDQGLGSGRTASRAIGYREVAAYLAGETSLDQAREQTARATSRFARRQATWHRRDPRIHWIDWDDPERVDRSLAAIERVRRGAAHPPE